jgi:hypothetical protein
MQENDITDLTQLVKVTTAARLCGLKRPSFYAALSSLGGLQPVYIDGAPYFDRQKLKAWNDARKAKKKRRFHAPR